MLGHRRTGARFAGVLFLTLAGPALAQGLRTFGGYDCTIDCSGHAAGYRWAEDQDVHDESDCPLGNSNSFYEGCLAYTEDPSRGADEDDDGRPIF